MRLKLAGALLAGSIAFGSGAQAQQLDKKKFNVIGTWNFLTNWQGARGAVLDQGACRRPRAASIKGNIKSVTEVNLKGTEVLRLLKQGVFDFAAALPIYVEDGGAIIEAVDIAGVARSFKMSREITDAWMAEMQKVMKERTARMILALLHLAGAELLLPRRHQERRGPEGQEDPRAGHLAGRSRQGARRLGRDDRLRRGRAGAREGRRRLRHHRHHAGLQGEVAGGDQHAVPPARRLHGRHSGSSTSTLEQAVAGHAGVPEEASSRRSRTSPGRRSRPRPRTASPARPARRHLPGGSARQAQAGASRRRPTSRRATRRSTTSC